METRRYPSCCTSAFCGSFNCQGCRNEAKLLEFKEWVKQHAAQPADPIWSPNLLVATR